MYAHGMGATSPNLANPNAGTFLDVNCPWWCWVLGNGIDTSVSSQCFPCGNVCPTGQVWDTTNLTCSATPATSNASPDSNNTPTDTTDYTPWLIGGGILLALLATQMLVK